MFDWIRRALLLMVGMTLLIGGIGSFQLLIFRMAPAKLSSILLLAFCIISWPVTGHRLPRNRKHPAIIAFAAAIIIGCAVSLMKGFPVTALWHLWTTFLAVVIFAFLIPYAIRVERDLEILLLGLVIGGVFAVLGGEVLGLETADEAGRLGGTAGQPNVLAEGLVCVLPITLALLFSTSGGFRKLLLMGAVVLGAAGIVLSLSRGAFVSAVAMWGLWVWRFRRLDTIKYTVPVLALALGIMLLAPSSFFERINTMSAEERQYESSIQGRILGSYMGMRAFFSSPLVGIGIRQAGIYIHERVPSVPAQHNIHNTYASVAAELGLAGLIPFGLIILFSWRDYTLVWQMSRRQLYRDDLELRRLAQRAIFLQISFLGILVFVLFAPAVTSKAFWLLIGLSSAVIGLAKARVRAEYPQPAAWSSGRVDSTGTGVDPPTPSADSLLP